MIRADALPPLAPPAHQLRYAGQAQDRDGSDKDHDRHWGSAIALYGKGRARKENDE